jgi:NAD(P)-dependent dehydrogenase (short-subunit alcohol dehydrogenase family)
MKRLSGKNVIVTGAGRGLGRGIALKLAEEGAKVVVADVTIEAGSETVEQIKNNGGEAIAVAVNIADSESVKAMFEKVINELGEYNAIVNNAGINRDAMLHKMTNVQWDQVISVDLTGTFYCVQEATKYLREKGAGAIVNISSGSWLGNIGQANYAAAKAGVVGLTKTAARELARKGVTCNAICPGFIETDMTKSMSEAGWNTMMAKIPMGYAGKPKDVANLVAFLVSEEATYITGEVINVGGGMIV